MLWTCAEKNGEKTLNEINECKEKMYDFNNKKKIMGIGGASKLIKAALKKNPGTL